MARAFMAALNSTYFFDGKRLLVLKFVANA